MALFLASEKITENFAPCKLLTVYSQEKSNKIKNYFLFRDLAPNELPRCYLNLA
jgi:hypothetical protein